MVQATTQHHTMPMCLINMNDAVDEGVKAIRLAANECQCHVQSTPAPPTTSSRPQSAGIDNPRSTNSINNHPSSSLPSVRPSHASTSTTGGMVVDLHHHHHQAAMPQCHHHQGRMVGGLLERPEVGDRVYVRPQPTQFALLPVRIADAVVPTELSSGTTSNPSTHGLPLVTVTADSRMGGAIVGTGGHCACCRFNRDSGFSDDASCDSSAFHLVNAPVLSFSSTTTGQHQHNKQHQHQQQKPSHQKESQHRISGFQFHNNNSQLIGQNEVSQTKTSCERCARLNSQNHSAILRHHSNSPVCSFCHNSAPQTNHAERVYENASILQRNKSSNIPRIVCHSPGIGDGTVKSSVDSGISSPTLSDTHSLSGSAKPDLHHSKSLQEDDLSHHHKRCQLTMAGGHLSIQQTLPNASTLRQHRHSTGSVLECLQNKLNSIAHTPNSEEDLQQTTTRSTLTTTTANNVNTSTANISDDAVFLDDKAEEKSNQNGLVNIQIRGVNSWPALHTSTATMESNSEDSSSARTAMSGLSLGSSSAWEGSDDLWGMSDFWPSQRSNSPSGGESSGGSSGDDVACSGSSDISWAMAFTGAAENAQDWKTLKLSTQKLGKCGFYYEHMSMEQAKLMLKPLPVGVFLLRDSSNKKYLFSLSAKTPRGVTSVRIEYRNALFRLDSDEKSQSQMPGFNCVLKLIQYYVQLSEDKRTRKCVWLESSGRKDTPVMLTKPAIQGVSSLTQLCRKVIHRHVPMDRLTQNLKTDFTLLQYLKEYPYYV